MLACARQRAPKKSVFGGLLGGGVRERMEFSEARALITAPRRAGPGKSAARFKSKVDEV